MTAQPNPIESFPMEEGTAGAEVTQRLDQAVADYQRHYGRPQTIEKLGHMQRARIEAQRVVDESIGALGEPIARAAE